MKRPSRKNLIRAYENVAATESGKIVLGDILNAAGVWRDGFLADQHLANFRKGERNIGLMVIDRLLKASPRNMSMVLGAAYEPPESQEKPEENDNA